MPPAPSRRGESAVNVSSEWAAGEMRVFHVEHRGAFVRTGVVISVG